MIQDGKSFLSTSFPLDNPRVIRNPNEFSLFQN